MPAPVLTELTAAVTFAEDTVNATPQLLFASANVADVEGNWTGGHLIISGVLAQDRLSVLNQGVGAGQIGFNSGTGVISYGGVVIGTATGGSGVTLDITFAAGATTAAVEALFKAITYGNVSQTPTAIRDLSISLTDGSGLSSTGRADFAETASALDDLHLPPPSYLSSPATADLDGDGDLDIVVGTSGGLVAYVRNTGTAAAPVYVQQTGGANPFDAIDTGDNWNNVSLADMDGDGDFDLVVATVYGLRYYRNDGTTTAPVFSDQTATAANRLPAGLNTVGASAVLIDFSGDGKVDLVANNHSNGQMRYFLNTGTAAAPVFTEQADGANPFQGLFVQGRFTLGDADRDGDLDLVHLNSGGTLVYVENVGGVMTTRSGSSSPVWGSGAPFYPGNAGVPFFIDLDGDGDLDLGAGENDGMVWRSYLNTLTTNALTTRVTVNAQADAAIAVNDTFSVDAGAPFSGNVATNDTGVDGGAPVVTEVNGVSAGVGSEITLASGARLTLNANGTLTYNPNGAFNALGGAGSGAANLTAHEDVTYTLTGGVTATVRFNITGVDDADALVGTGAANIIDGGALNDVIDGGAGNDTLFGSGGDDYLKGGAGVDLMRGGTGNDTYVVDNVGDAPDETGGDGVDIVMSHISWTLADGIENLTLGAGGRVIDGIGNGSNNLIIGNDFANSLHGAAGDDTLRGAGGADILYGGPGEDQLYGGIQNDALYGGVENDQLFGEGGADILDGGLGGDAMDGGAGNDTYYLDGIGDTIVELAGGGTDTAYVSFGMSGIILPDHVETIIATVTSDYEFTYGGNLANTLHGNVYINYLFGRDGDDKMYGYGGFDIMGGDAGNDTLHGGVGDDTLTGGLGDDRLFGESDNDDLKGGNGADNLDGGAGDDRLEGGYHADVLTGGAGADRFAFSDLDIRSQGAGSYFRDWIKDFSTVDGDIIDLSLIDADVIADGDQAFAFAAKFTGAAGQATLAYNAASNFTMLRLDLDGDKLADLEIRIDGDARGVAVLTGGEPTGTGGWIL